MIKRTIQFEDFDGNPASEDFWFHLSKAELIELDSEFQGGLDGALKAIVATNDANKIIKIFKQIILAAHGQRSVDGKKFYKSDEIRAEFEASAAYSELFMKLATDAEFAASFIQGVLPASMLREIEAQGGFDNLQKQAEDAILEQQRATLVPEAPKTSEWAAPASPASNAPAINEGV